MKNYVWLKHNSILLINLCVVGLMLWLTVSFLLLAVEEREQAASLQSSVEAQKSIFVAGITVADFASSGRTLNKNQNIESMFALTGELANKKGFYPNSRNNRENMTELKKHLKAQLNELERHRDSSESNSNTVVSPTKLIADIHSNMIALSESAAYLPNAHSTEILVLHSLITEALTLGFELSRYKEILSSDSRSEALSTAATASSLNHLRTLILDCLNAIDSLNLSVDTRAYVDSSGLLDWNKNNGLAILKVDKAFTTIPAERENLRNSIATISRQLELVTTNVFNEIESISDSQTVRADRNIVIDVTLLLLCLLVACTTALLNRRVNYLAYHDHLTGLSNRVSLEYWLSMSISAGPKTMQKQALIFIDLDRFKSVNDNYGHEFGDALLKMVSKRIVNECSPNAVVSRLGGDEFCVFLNDIESEEAVMQLANKLIELISADIKIGEHVVKVNASAGVSVYPDDCDSAPSLLNNADIAMLHNKEAAVYGAYRFDHDIANYYKKRLQMELDLKSALKNNEFELYYQPKVGVISGKVESVEALLRWNSPKLGYVTPFEFIPMAEELGLMGDIGNWVLHKACVETAELQRYEGLTFSLAVNISVQQFRDEHFEVKVNRALDASGLLSEQLELEVTESLIMNDRDRVISLLHSLRAGGVKIAIDDFGTGFSSLQYLQQLPLDTLKIDRAFILALDGGDPKDSVANSIVQLAALFNLETVAEGVETQEQDDKIRALGVNYIQGYRYSKPIPSAELAAAIRAIPDMFKSDSDDQQSNAA